MKRTYLEEDMQLIRAYFPGARSVALRTPFDLTNRQPKKYRSPGNPYRDKRNPRRGGAEDLAWTR